jgi:DNA-binding transcriptional MocR family regulator
MPDLRTNSGVAVDLQVDVSRDSPVPLHRQLENAIRGGVRSGQLRGDRSLPPTRTLAAALGVSRGVVVEAYQQLTAEGYPRRWPTSAGAAPPSCVWRWPITSTGLGERRRTRRTC